jgi:hypothetical protein
MFLSLFAVSGGCIRLQINAKIKNMRRFCTASSLGSRGLVYMGCDLRYIHNLHIRALDERRIPASSEVDTE